MRAITVEGASITTLGTELAGLGVWIDSLKVDFSHIAKISIN